MEHTFDVYVTYSSLFVLKIGACLQRTHRTPSLLALLSDRNCLRISLYERLTLQASGSDGSDCRKKGKQAACKKWSRTMGEL